MKYKVLYDTQILNTFYKKDSFIGFKSGTDEYFIQRLIADKIILDFQENIKKQQKNKRKTDDDIDDKSANIVDENTK